MSLILGCAIAGFHLLPHGHDVPLSRPLAALPYDIGSWHGADFPIDSSQVQNAAVDDYLNRVYQGGDGTPLALYIGYYRSQRTGESIHSPLNCLPGSGWQPIDSQPLSLAVGTGPPVMVNQYVVQKGIERQVVIYWYQSHRHAEASELQAKLDLVVDAIRWQRTDSALVRINTPLAGNDPGRPARDFAVAILTQLKEYLP